MRVISGDNKGRKLITPKNMAIRPTTDKIKESIFNIIGNINHDDKILDLFSGTGSIGIEFLSRSAKECYFIDNSYESIKIIKANINNCKLDYKSKIYKSDYKKAIKIFGKKNIKFDYIYADPPYNKFYGQDILDIIIKENILNNSGLLIIESEENEKICINNYKNMLKYKERKYGITKLSFFIMEADNESNVFREL